MAKVDRRILKTQESLKRTVIELMAKKNFDDITIQDIADQANVNRGTIYLHYQDKYDLLDRIIETHINELKEMDTWACEMEWSDALVPYFEYFEKNYLLFSTMLASKGSPSSFRTRLLASFMEGFKGEIDKESGKNADLIEDVMLHYAGTAYVGVIEWWIRTECPIRRKSWPNKSGPCWREVFNLCLSAADYFAIFEPCVKLQRTLHISL